MNRRGFFKGMLGALGLAPLKAFELGSEIESVVEIAPDQRYILVMPAGASFEEAHRTAKAIGEWWDSDHKIAVTTGGMRLVRVDSPPDVRLQSQAIPEAGNQPAM